jgi:hypothetical protein
LDAGERGVGERVVEDALETGVNRAGVSVEPLESGTTLATSQRHRSS